jgi:AcrR family transcriptional regulator
MATPTRKRLPRAEREKRMLDAAQQVFGQTTFAGASMEEIAERSGITKALLYQYFGSKEGLYESTIERGRADLFAALQAAVEGEPPGATRLVAFVNGYFDYIERHRSVSWLLYGEASSAAVNAMRERNAELVGELLAETMAQQGRVPDPEALTILAHSLVAAGEQVARWWIGRDDVSKQVAVDRFLVVASGAIDAVFRAAAATH